MSTETQLPSTVKQEAAPALFAKKPKALEIMASRMNLDPSKMLETLKATVFKNCSNEEMAALVVVANEYGLNPLLKEMYAFPGKGGGIVPIVSIDGWNKMMIRADNFDGIEFSFEENGGGLPKSCTAIVYLKNRTHPVKVTEHYSECFRPTEPWKTMPRRMLRHKALIQAARIGFGFSGIYDEDEGRDQADLKKLDAAKPVFDQMPALAEPSPMVAMPASTTHAEPTETKPESDGSKTRRVNAVCQAEKLEIGAVLAYLGEMGHPSFEDVPDRLLESIEKRPAQFASAVKGGAK